MAQKLTLTEYLRRRGAIKALTRIEAEAFGIPWPLQSGWPAKFAGMEITAEMLADLRGRMTTAKQSTVKKARCGLDGVTEDTVVPTLLPKTERLNVLQQSPVQGFVMKFAKRHRLRMTTSKMQKARRNGGLEGDT